jgi:hypothetical protein
MAEEVWSQKNLRSKFIRRLRTHNSSSCTPANLLHAVAVTSEANPCAVVHSLWIGGWLIHAARSFAVTGDRTLKALLGTISSVHAGYIVPAGYAGSRAASVRDLAFGSSVWQLKVWWAWQESNRPPGD